jgi:hypothetical protein
MMELMPLDGNPISFNGPIKIKQPKLGKEFEKSGH